MAPIIARYHRVGVKKALPLACSIALMLGSGLGAQQGETPEERIEVSVIGPGTEDEPAEETRLLPPPRKTIAPWIVDVYGKNYESFTNEGASRVISDWLTNALIDLDLFNIVDRERIRAVLSEKNLAMSGIARDISGDIPENELATAGRLLSVNYILLGNVKNLGTNSEIDFKLLDVLTTTYSPVFRLNFEIPFNPSIERFKPVLDRIVGELAASFPIIAEILEITPEGHFLLAAGSTSGLVEGLPAQLWSRLGSQSAASGVITWVGETTARMALEEPFPIVSILDYVAKIAIAPGAESVLSNARLEMSRGQFEEARKILAAASQSYPGHVQILALHARSCWQLQDYEGAMGSYRAALEAEPNDLQLLQEAVQVLIEAGRFQEVVELLSDADRGTKSIELELKLGDALAAQGYPLQAREAYKRAFRRDPASPGPHLRLAVLAARSGELSETERELRLARESGAKSTDIELAAAVFAELQSESPSVERARPWVDRAFEDGNFTALASASELLLSRPDLWRFALELAEKTVELNPAFLHGRRLMAEAHVLGGQLPEAITALEEALDAHPNSAVLLVRSGELLSEIGDYRSAELRLLQAMDLAPLQWKPADALGDNYVRQAAYLKAVDAYQRALRIAEQGDAPDLTTRLRKLGRAAVLGNQHATALPYLERCVAASPDNKECRHYLGVCHYVAGLPQSDEQAIVNLRAAEGFHADGSYYLGALYDRREDFFTARDWYQKCVDTGCSLAAESSERVDQIETIRGTIVSRPRGIKEVNLNVGSIHGVQPSQVASVLSGHKIIGRIRTEQVQEKTSVARILNGKPLTGHTVLFRPTRPRGLTVEKAPQRGVTVTWQPSWEPGLSHYIVYRKGGRDPSWKPKKRLSSSKNQFVDKSAKPGNTYSYRVVAVSEHDQESVASLACEILVE